MLKFRVVTTAFGHAAFVADERRLMRVYLPEPSAKNLRAIIHRDFPGSAEDDALDPRLARDLSRYFAGEPVEFDVNLAWDDASEFTRRVWQACRSIPHGHVSTYGELAALAGRPGAARAAGYAMRCNRWPIVVPCHRVLAAGGGLGGYSGPGGLTLKRRLLSLENAPGHQDEAWATQSLRGRRSAAP